MTSHDVVDIRVRRVSADALDSIRPLARKFGFRHTNADVTRFALEMLSVVFTHLDQPELLQQLLSAGLKRPGGARHGPAPSVDPVTAPLPVRSDRRAADID